MRHISFIKTFQFTLMIAFSLGADAAQNGTWERMDFFLFVTITSWIIVIAVFVLFVVNIISKINLNIDWNIPVSLLIYPRYITQPPFNTILGIHTLMRMAGAHGLLISIFRIFQFFFLFSIFRYALFTL